MGAWAPGQERQRGRRDATGRNGRWARGRGGAGQGLVPLGERKGGVSPSASGGDRRLASCGGRR
eukprot:5938456-Lingulodinium_polyedra.AAC.1